MKIWILIAFLSCFNLVEAQRTVSVVLIDSEVQVFGEIETFVASQHSYDTCEAGEVKYICKIDNKPWFGSDAGMHLPIDQLKRLELKIGDQIIPLHVSGMFNPNFSGKLSSHQFRYKTYKKYAVLYSFFSDGAGTYTVHWKIVNGKSERIKISTQEEDFQWQFE